MGKGGAENNFELNQCKVETIKMSGKMKEHV